jgi:hypothetical protein
VNADADSGQTQEETTAQADTVEAPEAAVNLLPGNNFCKV